MKRFMLIFVVAVTIVYSGCASGSESGGAAAQTTGNNSVASEQNENEDYRVLSFLGPDSTNPFIKFGDREEYATWHELMRLFSERGLAPEFEVVPHDQYLTTIQTRLASATNLPDFMQISSLDLSTVMNLVSQGMILSVTDIIEGYSDGTAKNFYETGKGVHSRLLNTAEDGHMYWISQIQMTTFAGELASTSMGMTIRKDWLDKVNLPMPATAEEFRQALIAFRENDVNGNGLEDEVLVSSFTGFYTGIAQWFGLVGELSSFIIEEGVVTSPWYQPGARAYFEYLNQLVQDNVLDVAIVGNTTGDMQGQRVAENRAAALYTYTMQTWEEPATGDPDALYLQVHPTVGTAGITPVLAIEPPRLSFGRWIFTRELTDFEAAGRLLDLLSGEEYEILTQWGIEGDTYEWVDGERQLMDMGLSLNWEQAAQQRIAIGDILYANGFMFMKRRFVPMENEINVVPEAKAQSQLNLFGYSPTTPLGTTHYFPVMTQAQVERRLELITDLNTRSTELMAQLILGHAPLENWDSYIAELEALGLAEIIAIDQTVLDRYLNFQ